MSRITNLSLLFFLTVFLWGCSGDTSSGPGNNEDPINSFSHKQGTGASAHALLSGDDFSTLIIEIDYVDGFAPSQTALNNLKSFLEARLNKPGGISIVLDEAIQSPGQASFTIQEVADLEDQYRDTFTEGSTLATYFIILDGEYTQSSVLGIAYYNTSMVLFEEVIRNNTGGIGQPSATTVETAVLQHEFGHIMGLVNNGSDMVAAHEDPEHEKHCNDDTCLMYWAIQTTDLMGNLTGGNIPELDSQCLQDLQANGGR